MVERSELHAIVVVGLFIKKLLIIDFAGDAPVMAREAARTLLRLAIFSLLAVAYAVRHLYRRNCPLISVLLLRI